MLQSLDKMLYKSCDITPSLKQKCRYQCASDVELKKKNFTITICMEQIWIYVARVSLISKPTLARFTGYAKILSMQLLLPHILILITLLLGGFLSGVFFLEIYSLLKG